MIRYARAWPRPIRAALLIPTFLPEPGRRVHHANMAAEMFTDAELAFLRHARFGELPSRVLPEDRVELAETDPPRAPIDLGLDPDQQKAINAGH
jgi:hypothetical protein